MDSVEELTLGQEKRPSGKSRNNAGSSQDYYFKTTNVEGLETVSWR